jgi:hypothetical protein
VRPRGNHTLVEKGRISASVEVLPSTIQPATSLLPCCYVPFTLSSHTESLQCSWRQHLYCVTWRTAVSEKMPMWHGVRSVGGWEWFILGPGFHRKTDILLTNRKICMSSHVLVSCSLEIEPNTYINIIL